MKTKIKPKSLLVLSLALLFVGCAKKETEPEVTLPTTPTYSFSGTSSDELMFEDG